MSRRKITEDIHLLWQRHDNAEATIEKLQEWTTDRRDYFCQSWIGWRSQLIVETMKLIELHLIN